MRFKGRLYSEYEDRADFYKAELIIRDDFSKLELVHNTSGDSAIFHCEDGLGTRYCFSEINGPESLEIYLVGQGTFYGEWLIDEDLPKLSPIFVKLELS